MGIPRVLLRWATPRGNRQTRTMSPRATVVLPYIRGLSEPIQRILAPLHIRMCFVRTEPHPKSLFTQKILCHLTRERESCIKFLVLTATWCMLARQDTPSRSAGKNIKSPDKCRSPDLSSGWTCTGPPPWHRMERSRGFGFQPMSDPKMCIRGMAYSFPAPPYEQRIWSATSSV